MITPFTDPEQRMIELGDDAATFDFRSKETLLEAETEIARRIWYYHSTRDYHPLGESGRKRFEEDFGEEAAREIREMDSWNLGYLSGLLSAIRWANGWEWGMLDT